VTRTTDLRFNFTQRALDQTFRRNPGIFDDAGDQLRRRQHRLVVAIGRTFAVYPALGARVACALRSAAVSAGVNGSLLTELSVLGCESIVLPFTGTRLCVTVTVPPTRSMSDQNRPHSAPRRMREAIVGDTSVSG
jgi:hypothetical protein